MKPANADWLPGVHGAPGIQNDPHAFELLNRATDPNGVLTAAILERSAPRLTWGKAFTRRRRGCGTRGDSCATPNPSVVPPPVTLSDPAVSRPGGADCSQYACANRHTNARGHRAEE